jgi:hypothetical protein
MKTIEEIKNEGAADDQESRSSFKSSSGSSLTL